MGWPDAFRIVSYTTAQHTETPYYVQDFTDEYRGFPGQFAVCYSPKLEEQKRRTVAKRADKEHKELADLARASKKRAFACEADALQEIETLRKKKLSKVRYHQVKLEVAAKEQRERDRSRKDAEQLPKNYTYFLVWTMTRDEERIESAVKREATFVLTTNDLKLPAEAILQEYRTQSSVEKKFQQLKSPHFVNSLTSTNPSASRPWCISSSPP